jgi:hypothetical protein
MNTLIHDCLWKQLKTPLAGGQTQQSEVLLRCTANVPAFKYMHSYFTLLNVHGGNGVKQTEIHTAEPLVPEASASEFELAIEKLKSHKSPGIDQIPAELIKAGCKTLHCVILKLIISIWNKEELSEE